MKNLDNNYFKKKMEKFVEEYNETLTKKFRSTKMKNSLKENNTKIKLSKVTFHSEKFRVKYYRPEKYSLLSFDNIGFSSTKDKFFELEFVLQNETIEVDLVYVAGPQNNSEGYFVSHSSDYYFSSSSYNLYKGGMNFQDLDESDFRLYSLLTKEDEETLYRYKDLTQDEVDLFCKKFFEELDHLSILEFMNMRKED